MGESQTSNTIRIAENNGETITVFDQLVTLPKRVVTAEDVRAVIKTPLDNLMKGDTIKIECIPNSNFKLKIEYE